MSNDKFEKFEKQNKPSILGNYRIEKTVGEGTFGKVKIATHIPTQEKV